MYLFFVGMCFNASAMILQNAFGITPASITPWNTTQLEGAYNATELIDSWDWVDTDFYDIGSGIRWFWDINVPVIEAVPAMFQQMGAPTEFLDPIKIIWRAIWVTFVISFVSGRDL